MSLNPDEEELLKTLTSELNESDKSRVKDLVEKSLNGDTEIIDGARELIELVLSIGRPVPQILIPDLISKCDISDNKKDYFTTKAKELMNGPIGCIKSEPFIDITTGQNSITMFVFKLATENHSIETELDNLLRKITTDKEKRKTYRPMIEKQLQQVIRNGHGTYCHMKDACATIFSGLENSYPEGFDPEKIEYNFKLGQFSLDIEDGLKVGIYIEVVPVDDPRLLE
jgi:hypothetical protein